ncbi:maleylpyruvate isomerase N-terminal domain-containing protein [Spirillospora sp. NPDC048911]|uniref:maleylpyruvate isomerase N-terminal domain-containing protein n=1 Tax=Spirillospora sp. NPDC048911 TaxID=3364527 RepID=UPI00371E591A
MTTRETYLGAAESAVGLLADPAVAAAWKQPSALADFTVGGLAAHLAFQIFCVPTVMATPAEEPIGLLDHYARASWVEAGLDDEPNVALRRRGEELAAEGPERTAGHAREIVAELRTVLPDEPADRTVHMPWNGWSLLLDDFLVTRTMELTVHSDDLAVSVGVPTLTASPEAADAVAVLLTRLAVRRHGLTPVMRALSRAERAPSTIAAF